VPEVSWAELSRTLSSGVLPPLAESPTVLQSATAEILDAMVRSTAEKPKAASHGIAGFLAHRRDLLAAVLQSYQAVDGSPVPRGPSEEEPVLLPTPPAGSSDIWWAAQVLGRESAQVEASLRESLPEVSPKFTEVEQAADEINADPETEQMVKRIAGTVTHHAASGLSPIGLLVILWWLFVVAFPRDAANDVAVLALWYAVARDAWMKKDD
jgi:hypothetical protein